MKGIFKKGPGITLIELVGLIILLVIFTSAACALLGMTGKSKLVGYAYRGSIGADEFLSAAESGMNKAYLLGNMNQADYDMAWIGLMESDRILREYAKEAKAFQASESEDTSNLKRAEANLIIAVTDLGTLLAEYKIFNVPIVFPTEVQATKAKLQKDYEALEAEFGGSGGVIGPKLSPAAGMLILELGRLAVRHILPAVMRLLAFKDVLPTAADWDLIIDRAMPLKVQRAA